MMNCVREFNPGYDGTLYEFWQKCTKNHFAEFMATKGICRNTLWKKFTANNWSELEQNGIKGMYHYWLNNVEKSNKNNGTMGSRNKGA